MIRSALIFLWVFSLLYLTACDGAHHSDGTTKVSWLTKCPDFSDVGKAPVEQNAECGSLELLENPQDASSINIPVNVLRLPAVNPAAEKDPLFVIAGGPGQSAVTLAETVHTTFNDVRKNRDIIFIDQRGTGKSNPFNCSLDDESIKQLPLEKQEAAERAALQECIDKYKNHVAYYTTPYAVADLDAVRKALGYEKINLWGGSYGSRVVLEYLRRFPAHARAAVIDGVAPVAIALPWFMEADGLAALQSINKQCAEDTTCVATYGDIVQKAEQVSAQLARQPLSMTIPHPRKQEKITVQLTADDFSSVIRFALYNRELSTLLPQVISEAASGDYQVFASFIYLAKSKSDLMGINYGMHFSVVCAEDYPLYRAKNVIDSNVFLHAQMVQKYSTICAQWPKVELPQYYWEPIKSDVPTLVLSGGFDPATPPHWAELVLKNLTHATHVVAPGGHHIITQEGCVAQLIAEFVAKGDGASLESECVNNIQPLAIHLPSSTLVNSSYLSLPTENSSAHSNSIHVHVKRD